MTAVILFVIFVAHFAQLIHGQAPTTLKLISLLYRHGDRNPIEGLLSMNETEADWPPGFGQLTTLGMKQEYDLGNYIRQRYDGFLSKQYARKEIYVSSTDVDRCLMSAQCVLSALYPPEGEQQWNPDIKWQPVPVHTTPKENDVVFGKANCEKLKQQKLKISQRPEVYNYIKEKYGDLLKDTYSKAGYEFSLANSSNPFKPLGRINDNFFIWAEISDIVTKVGYLFDENNTVSYTYDNAQLRHAVDILQIMKLKNKPLPAWATDERMTKIREEILPYLRYVQTSDHLVRKYTGGPLLTKMVTDMKLRADGNLEPTMKMFMYSAHDTTVIAVLSALDIYDNSSIHYSTLVSVELHQQQATKQFYVQVWLRTNSSEPTLLQIPGCEANCTFEKFMNLTNSMMIADRYRECVLYTSLGFSTYQNKVIFLALIGSVLLVVSLIFLGVLCHKKCGRAARPIKYRVHENTELPESLPMISSGGLSDED